MLVNTKQKEPLRILLIRFSSIGDVVLTTPVISSIKEYSTDARVDYLTLSDYSILLKDNPYIDNLFIIKRSIRFPNILKNLLILRKIKYDYIFDLHRSTRSLLFRFFLKSKKKYKFKKNYLKRLLLTAFQIRIQNKPYTVVNRYFDTTKILHLRHEGKTEIWFKPDDIQKAINKIKKITGVNCQLYNNDKTIKNSLRIEKEIFKIFKDKPKVISFMPFAKWQTKEWGDDKFIELGHKLNEYGEIKIQILGGQGDSERAKKIAAAIGKNAISFSGMLSLTETAVALCMSDCLITNDTGIMHIGGAVSIPVVAVFGCTTEELGFFPYNTQGEVVQLQLPCRPCTAKGLSLCPKRHFKCMNNITVEMVFSSLRRHVIL